MTPRFIQLDPSDCDYLLNLISEMDGETVYTEKQRGYTVPKLQQIAKDPFSARLAYQDQEYLLELIEDDSLPEVEDQRNVTYGKLMELKTLRESELEKLRNKEDQRELRRSRRMAPETALAEHFSRTQV